MLSSFLSLQLALSVSDFLDKRCFDDHYLVVCRMIWTVATVCWTVTCWLVLKIDEVLVHLRVCAPLSGGRCDASKATVVHSSPLSISVASTWDVLMELLLGSQ